MPANRGRYLRASDWGLLPNVMKVGTPTRFFNFLLNCRTVAKVAQIYTNSKGVENLIVDCI